MRRSGASMPGIVSTAIYIFMSAWEEMFFLYQLP
jgi:ABC-type glycerol-3-phosphate transport system permease component